MHFQIRNKEKYLLISMVGYLLIVSSALLIIFSPVQAYTELKNFTISPYSSSWSWSTNSYRYPTTGAGDDAKLYYTDITWIHLDNVVARSASCSGSGSGDMTRNSGSLIMGTYDIDWTLTDQGSGCAAAAGVPLEVDIYLDWGPYATAANWTGSDITFTGFGAPFATHGRNPDSDNGKWGPNIGSVPGTYTIYGGTSLPDVPVINSVTSYPSCLEPGTGVVLESNVTGTVDDWTWEVYQGENSVFTGTTAIEQMIDPYVLSPGDYDVQLTVENTGGSDFWQQDNFIYVNQSGTCNFTEYNPFPTISTTPTQNVYATMTMPPSVVVNISGVNEIIDNSYLGNMSAGYRSYVDQIGEGFNTTLVGVVSVVQSPLTMVVNGIAEGISLFSVSVNSLMSYTTIPLAIVGITLSYYPWQIITLITAGIAIDAAFVLIFGVR